MSVLLNFSVIDSIHMVQLTSTSLSSVYSRILCIHVFGAVVPLKKDLVREGDTFTMAIPGFCEWGCLITNARENVLTTPILVTTPTIYGHAYGFLNGAHHDLSKGELASCKQTGERCKLATFGLS